MLVETAILLPVIILITFGVIEFSSAYQSAAVGTAAARAAARQASAEALVGTFATDAAQSASSALHTIPNSEPVEMWVYKADSNGYPTATGNFSACTTDCIKYLWSTGSKSFDTANPQGGGWPASSMQACNQSIGWDSVGVYIKVHHAFLTTLFGSGVTLTDHAVFRLEPAPTVMCTT